MKVYISGKISELPFNEVEEKFSSAERDLKTKKIEVINPPKFNKESICI